MKKIVLIRKYMLYIVVATVVFWVFINMILHCICEHWLISNILGVPRNQITVVERWRRQGGIFEDPSYAWHLRIEKGMDDILTSVKQSDQADYDAIIVALIRAFPKTAAQQQEGLVYRKDHGHSGVYYFLGKEQNELYVYVIGF